MCTNWGHAFQYKPHGVEQYVSRPVLRSFSHRPLMNLVQHLAQCHLPRSSTPPAFSRLSPHFSQTRSGCPVRCSWLSGVGGGVYGVPAISPPSALYVSVCVATPHIVRVPHGDMGQGDAAVSQPFEFVAHDSTSHNFAKHDRAHDLASMNDVVVLALLRGASAGHVAEQDGHRPAHR
jgi:hypothetical protein